MILNDMVEVKKKLLEGINLVANTVKPTLGPQAKTVILQGNPPVIINDGVTITKYISHDDPYVQMGIQLVQNLASKAQDNSGDGTTTACILAQAFCNNMIEYAEDKSIHDFNILISELRDKMISHLDDNVVEVDNDDILNVATIAANNDRHLGSLIKGAIDEVGRDGIITVEESNNYNTEIDIRKGMEINEGYLSHLMCNTENGRVEFDNPLVFMSNLSIRKFSDIMPLLEFSSTNNRPLVIFCKGFDGSAMNNLVMNLLQKTVQCAVVLSPNFGDAQIDELGDMACALGGRVFVEESKDDPKVFTLLDLGTCKKVSITKESTTFIGTDEEKEYEVLSRIETLKKQAKTVKGHEVARLKNRIAKLSGGVATIRIGASSSIEMRETKERLDDALHATKAALEEGIVVGGGTLYASLAKDETLPKWFRDSLVQPMLTLIENSGDMTFIGEIGTKDSLENIIDVSSGQGYNALTNRVENLEEAGVFDPYKVVKNSFLAALSIASLFYSTDVAVLLPEA
jgi:chaperonin GroEL